MNTNDIILGGINAILNQLIVTAVAEAVKPLQERIAVLEGRGSEWTAMEHIVAKEIQPLQDRVIALEINQTLVSSAKINLADLVAELVDGHDFVKSIDAAIENYDFSDEVESAIENYDFSNIVEMHMPDIVDEDRVQEMINESLDNLTITRN